jgi:sarcosine oxidase subunit alpha
VRRPQPAAGEQIDRARRISFSFDGRPVSAFEGDTIASALFAAGQRTFSRSFKYHRPRGLMCCSGQCANCLVAVDGAPGVRACTEPARDGQRVEHLNAWPSLGRDAMAVVDRLPSRALPVGFYYKTFQRPRRLWPLYEKVLRHAAGLGRLPARQSERTWATGYRRRHADVLVVGGGAAGLSAAIAAAELGADVVLADEDVRPGGRLLDEGGHELAAELADRARDAGVELLSRAAVLGYYDGLSPVWQGDTLHQVRAREHIYATGTIEQPLLFGDNDRPGIMLSGGARRLLTRYGLAPGTRAVVATVGDRGLQAALALQQAGIRVAAVADTRPESGPTGDALRAAGVAVLNATAVRRAHGRAALTAVTLAPCGGGGANQTIEADLLVVSSGEAPAVALASQAGVRTAYDPRTGTVGLGPLPPGIGAAGAVNGDADAQESGRLAGLRAAHALGLGDAKSRKAERALAARLGDAASPDLAATNGARPPSADAPHPDGVAPLPTPRSGGRTVVCTCEDVTTKELTQAVWEGFDSIELAKRYSTVTMGPCQGRMCQLACIRLVADATGRPPAEIGSTTSRPPWATVPLGVLAGRPFEPAKRTPLHDRHRELGAHVRWAADWRRAYDYGDAAAEAQHVAKHVGVIDVSTLGKLLVRGPDAGALLDRLYPAAMSTLAVGRARYGLLTGETGRILDDGTICRLDEETFYVTTTSSGAGAVEQWFSWWLAAWGMDASVTDVTQALAAVNLAGPAARTVLSAVADLDCSNDAFPYLHVRSATVASVPCLLVRLGFTGELGYELHFAAPHADHVWQALFTAGAAEQLRPFGLEAQRQLRLEKHHVIVGQDTDSESTPRSAGMGWTVKLDRDAPFVGRPALALGAEADPEQTLVGLALPDGPLPAEGAVVLDAAGRPSGQVTSARVGPRTGRPLGMAWVPAELARDGATVVVADAGRRLPATVATRPPYDPDGSVVRA